MNIKILGGGGQLPPFSDSMEVGLFTLDNLLKVLQKRSRLENPGIDPGTSHMLSERSTI